MKPFVLFFYIFTLCALTQPLALAEIKIIEAETTYVIGDNESKVEARRTAVLEAKRKALETAGTYVSSLSQVQEYKLTKDEATAYTAGVVETEIDSEEMRGTTDHPEIYIKARCKIDTDILTQQIDNYRQNEELRKQLEASARESMTLRNQLDELRTQLRAERDKNKIEDTRKRMNDVLGHQESIDDTNRAWIRLLKGLDVYALGEASLDVDRLDTEISALRRAIKVNPRNIRARILLASIYHRQNKGIAAERELRDAIKYEPDNPFLHMQLGDVLRSFKRYRDALAEFRIMEERRPNEPHMLFLTGMTHKANGDCRIATSYLKRFMAASRGNDRPPFPSLRHKAVQVLKECNDHARRNRLRSPGTVSY